MVSQLNQPWPYLATAVFAALIGWYAWKQPDRPGTRHFHWMVGVWFVWVIAAALQTVASSHELQFWLWVIQSACALFGIPLQLLIVLEFTGSEKWPARRSLLLIFLPGFLFIALAIAVPNSLFSIEVHSGVGVFAASDLTKFSFIAYALLIILITVGVLFTNLLHTPAFRPPILLIILGQTLSAIGFLLVDPQQLTASPIQVAALLSIFTFSAYFVALYNFRLLRVMPVARDAIISRMPFGLIVLDAEDHLVDFNPAAQALPGMPGKLVLRQPGEKALGSWWERLAPLIGPENVGKDVFVQIGSQARIFQVRSLPLLQSSGWRIGQAFMLEEVTQARHEQQQRKQALWAQATLLEREQLADELHDGLSQSLAFLNMQAQAAQVYLQAYQGESALASLVRLIEASGEIQDDTRELIDHLLMVSLPAEDFCTTLRRILGGFEQQTGLAYRLELEGEAESEECFDSSRLPPPVAVQLVRITQEALANVRKHARGAEQVSVELKIKDGQLSLTIGDDGPGFDPAARPAVGKHYGLQVMRQRAARIGGQVAVISAPGKGTHIEVCVPLAAYEHGSDI